MTLLPAAALALVLAAVLLRDALAVSVNASATWLGWIVYAWAIGAFVTCGSRTVQFRLRDWCLVRPSRFAALALPSCLLAAAAAVSVGTWTWTGLVVSWVYLLGIVGIAWLAWRAQAPQDGRATWADFLLLVFMGAPFVLKLIPLWEVPPYMTSMGLPHQSMVGAGLAIPLLAIPVALLAFTVIRPVPAFEFSLALRPGDFTSAVAWYAAFVLLFGLPAGVASGMARPGLAHWPASEVAGTLAALFFLTASLEEFFFRGVLLNLLASRLSGPHRRWLAMLGCGVLFGLVHPPGMYRILALVAGLFYGAAYLVSGRLSVAVLMHAMVDFTWVFMFAG